MRRHALALCLLAIPAPLWADDIAVPSRVAEATVFPQGATLTRVASYEIPAGRHQLILTDMPRIDPASLRLNAPGLTVGAIRYRDDFVPPRTDSQTAEYEAAEALVEERERAVEVAQDAVASIQIEADTARARIAFLDGIGQSNDLAQVSADKLRELATLIGEEGLTARRAVQAAETRVREAQRAVKDAREDLADAEQALKALSTGSGDRAYLSIDVSSDGGAQGEMVLTYTVAEASWTPTYDVRLVTQGDAGLTLQNGAYVEQSTGEDWRNVALTLSTVRPSGQGQPGEVWPWLRRAIDPQRPEPMTLARGSMKAADMAVPAPVMEEVTATSQFDGLSVTYSYPDRVSVANEADAVKISLGTLDFTPEVFARAVPLSDPTAFLAAEFTNDSGELILGGGAAQFYLDGTFVGQRYLDLIANGDKAELSFGPIEGLRLERVVLDRQEGDRGVITRRNEQNEEVQITLRNLTARSWSVRLRDRVPYSEQEDLEISWDAQPVPTETNIDDLRGVLEWRFDMAPKTDQRVELNHRIRWPDGKVLR
ncbi:mucoidy inhibitor MuiA family protein [Pseudooceanicola onchidii]|uniref:mucoidy inhibitor MuiA family protein n=1 Tax=Pseudooceanicola onchidii TaxID=2562279 RepID=UPI0010A9FD92|nr:mucoidy inhibitor MuiA family protein [Pseudooceanicola onchidii]